MAFTLFGRATLFLCEFEVDLVRKIENQFLCLKQGKYVHFYT